MTPEMYVAAGIAAFVLLVTVFVVGLIKGGARDAAAERAFDAKYPRLAELARRHDARQRERTDIYWNR